MHFVIIFIFTATFATGCMSDGLCSQMHQVYQSCINERGGESRSQVRRGKAGPRGPAGPPGLAAAVDYDAIKSTMADMFAEFRLEQEAKYRKLEKDFVELQKRLASDCPRSPDGVSEVSGGLFTIYPFIKTTKIYCDLETDGGGWTVFQRRMDGSVDFFRNWDDYVNGFGNKTGEFWLGLDLLHKLSSQRPVELRIDLEDWDGNKRYAKYSTFRIGDASSLYQINVSGYVGDASDSFSFTNGMKFSTKDKDSDTWGNSCARSYKGAWWYAQCHSSNLNGMYYKGGVHKSYADGVEWSGWKGQYYSMKFTEMKIRSIA